MVVAHTFNPSTWEVEAGGSLEFEVSLIYKVSSRTVRTVTRRKSLLKGQTNKHPNKQTNKKNPSQIEILFN